jgi:uncharacterized membrane protein YoaK (UPF0700 family)
MPAKYTFALISFVFLVAAAVRVARDAGKLIPQSRTWLMIAVIFAIVSGWLFSRG